jgi:glycosyltransferase involved in cell wall biosynthesis
MVGAKDLVTEGVNGWVVPAGEVDPLAEKMLWCVRNQDEVRAMRTACRKSAEAATWEAYSERFVALMRTLLG